MTTFYDLPKPNPKALARSQALSDVIVQEIDKKGGKLTFAEFMALALYHPSLGYYSRETFALGKQGDFITAPEISPLFAHCFAKQALQLIAPLTTKNILEIGAGTGRFAGDFLQALQAVDALPDHYFIYEISQVLREKQADYLRQHCPDFFSSITWLDTLPDHFTGVMIANEVLDALPTHCFHLEEKQVKERYVAYVDKRFVWHNDEPEDPKLAEIAEHLRNIYLLPKGYESEINLALPDFIGKLAASLTQGIILLADYGYGEAEYYHPERKQGTLSCFYQHHTHNDPLIWPGLQDITAHVNFTQVAESALLHHCELSGYTTQAAFLLSTGLLELASAAEKGLAPEEEFKLHQAIKLLTLPTEMGERIKMMALSKNISIPLLGFGFQDRRRDL